MKQLQLYTNFYLLQLSSYIKAWYRVIPWGSKYWHLYSEPYRHSLYVQEVLFHSMIIVKFTRLFGHTVSCVFPPFHIISFILCRFSSKIVTIKHTCLQGCGSGSGSAFGIMKMLGSGIFYQALFSRYLFLKSEFFFMVRTKSWNVDPVFTSSWIRIRFYSGGTGRNPACSPRPTFSVLIL